jgi:hypothetical protein
LCCKDLANSVKGLFSGFCEERITGGVKETDNHVVSRRQGGLNLAVRPPTFGLTQDQRVDL